MRAWTASAGFGLIAMLISALIVAILTVVVMTAYLDSVKSVLSPEGPGGDAPRPDVRARLAEAQALAGRVMTALTLCAQAKGPGQSCSREEVAGRAGLNTSTYTTADGRWQVAAATLALSGGMPPTLSGQVSISGVGGNAVGLSLTMFNTGGGVATRCNAAGSTPPSDPGSGQSC